MLGHPLAEHRHTGIGGGLKHTCGCELPGIGDVHVFDKASGTDGVNTGSDDAIGDAGVASINKHGDTHGLHNRSRLVWGAKGSRAHVLGGRIGEVVGIEGRPIRGGQNVPIVDPDNNRACLLCLESASVLR
ncbi:unannotated protein [freshwater metagenome]|uniref:Unannotated protein n=1 Tax=freshwater metagenome TaxID=449393 RepID=A0A6J6KEB5_9ZZZZ